MHSINEQGDLCINLNDYIGISDSIRLRHKIDSLMHKHHFPKELSHFSITVILRSGKRYYISNLYLWAIPYRTEGYNRGDIDHAFESYNGKEYFIQSHISLDQTQMNILKIMQERYKLFTVFAMVRQCYECDILIETYNQTPLDNKAQLYFNLREQMEKFIINFLQEMHSDLSNIIRETKFLNFFQDVSFRNQVITRKLNSANSILTPRELDCLFLTANSDNALQVADSLHLSIDTVNTHLKSVRKKLNCKTTTQAVFIAFKSDLFKSINSPNLGI